MFLSRGIPSWADPMQQRYQSAACDAIFHPPLPTARPRATEQPRLPGDGDTGTAAFLCLCSASGICAHLCYALLADVMGATFTPIQLLLQTPHVHTYDPHMCFLFIE